MAGKGVSQNAPVVYLASTIAQAREKFESMVRRTGADLVFEREARFALQIIQNSDMLQGSDPETVYNSIINVATLGLSLNPVQGEAALIPRWNSKKGMMDCTVSPMYRGLVRLATESGRVSHIKAELVFEADEFRIKLGTDPQIDHDPTNSILSGEGARVVDFVDKSRNKLRAVYLVANLSNGGKIVGVMSYDELLKVAMCSDSFNPKQKPGKPKRNPSGPWVYHPGEMAKKSIINRDQKTWPRASSGPDVLDRAMQITKEADENEGYVENAEPRAESEPAVETISEAQAAELVDQLSQQNMDPKIFCENYKIARIEDLPASELKGAKIKLEKRLKAYMAKIEKEKAGAA
jgi:recombination protein RecT